ncbi:unannotated protein [freshwater metagenome]|uniref:Unannotated protein n=1 Tax=freshwater metagenome TaxID=449393 RepID=A0A6J5Z7I3_9ZZZZ
MRKIVVIGAGIAGTAVADELIKLGEKDVTVLDKGPLFKTGGATSHAPGLVTRTSASEMMQRCADYTITKLLGMDVDGLPCFLATGAIEVAVTPERLSYLKRRREFAQSWGFDGRIIDPDEAAHLNPLLDPTAFIGAYHTTGEGIGKALRGAEAQGRRAISGGAQFFGNCEVTRIVHDGTSVTGVETTQGFIAADLIVLAAGGWGNALAKTAGVTLPMVAMEHQYAITAPIARISSEKGTDASLPFVRYWEGGVYMRNEDDCVGIGSFNHKALPVSDEEIVHGNSRRYANDPSMFEFTQEDWDPAWEEVIALMPDLRDAPLPIKYNGVFPYTPDGYPLLGQTKELTGLWILECLWATHSVGAARSLAQVITGSAPDIDITQGDLNRFDEPELAPNDYSIRCDNSYVDTYAIHHPNEPSGGPRNRRLTPFHAKQETLGGQFFDSATWERVRWFESNAELVSKIPAVDRDEWSAKFWSPISGAEHLATRETVGMFDMSTLRRILVTGRDASAFLNFMCARNVDGNVGSVIYTLMLNEHGRIVSDVTVSRIADSHYLVGGNSQRDVQWLQSHSDAYDVHIEDITTNTGCLAIWGPQARTVLETLTDADMSNESFKYFTNREIVLAGVPVTAVRVSYVGELGWELIADKADCAKLWDEVYRSVSDNSGVAAGRGALTSMRIEKGYRSYGTDMTRADTPEEAGLGFAVRRSQSGHLGLTSQAPEPRRMLRSLTIEGSTVPTFGQPVFAHGKCVGSVTSAEYGWSQGTIIAYAWLATSVEIGSEVSVHIAGEQSSARVVADCQFDHEGLRVRS